MLLILIEDQNLVVIWSLFWLLVVVGGKRLQKGIVIKSLFINGFHTLWMDIKGRKGYSTPVPCSTRKIPKSLVNQELSGFSLSLSL